MLEGLGKVDWEHVEHAYGPATDVPGWLRALAGDDAKARRKALADVDGAVNHQGWSTPASVPTTPFLVELLQAGIERAALALMLADFAVGGFHGNYCVTGMDPRTMPSELRPTREAIVAAHGTFVELLGDKDAKVRASAAVALGVLVERRDAARDALRARMAREKSQEPLACMLLALALLGVEAPPAEDTALARKLLEHTSALVQLAGRIALAQLEPSRASALAAMKASEGRPEKEKNVPWNEGRLGDLAQRVAMDALRRSGDLDALSEMLEVGGLERVVPHALELVFPGEKPPPPQPRAFEELTPAAQKFTALVGRLIEARRHANGYYDETLLVAYGLCDVVRLAGLRGRRPLDEGLEGEPRWRIARRVRDGHAPAEAWTDCLRASPVDLVEDVVRDLAASVPIPYALSMPWPKGEWGYDSQVRTRMRYEALIADATRLLPMERVLACMDWLIEPSAKVAPVPVVDVYTERLEGQPPDPRFDTLLTAALDALHTDGAAQRRILERVPDERRAALIEHIAFNLIVSDARDRPFGVFFRQAWAFADLCPTPELASRAATSLVGRRLLADHQLLYADAVTAEITPRLVGFFGPFGDPGRRSLRDVLPQAEPFMRGVIERVLRDL
jgi:hypothetical protein